MTRGGLGGQGGGMGKKGGNSQLLQEATLFIITYSFSTAYYFAFQAILFQISYFCFCCIG